MRSEVVCAIAAAVLLATSVPSVSQEPVTLMATEWPPYTGAALPEMGAASAVASAVFVAMDVSMDVSIVPWRRAISTASDEAEVVGYFPGYHCEHTSGFVASDPIGSGVLGFAERVEDPVAWTDIADIGDQNLRVGTVRGYANTDDFDRRAGSGWIRTVPAQDDTANLQSLALGRVDIAVIDERVLGFLLANDPALADSAAALRFDETALARKLLHVCFRDDAPGGDLRDRFNRTLSRIDAKGIFQAALDEMY